MARFIEGKGRRQTLLLPECLGEDVAADNPVRVIEAFVDEADLLASRFAGVRPTATGRPAYRSTGGPGSVATFSAGDALHKQWGPREALVQPHSKRPPTMGPKLFTPFRIGELELANRIVIAPMCQYSAEDGCMTDWHVIHLGQLALSGAALLTIEATAVLPEGRITYADVGLYSDRCEAAMGRVLESIRRWSDIPIAIQLGHAGRKASSEVPWKGGQQIPPDHDHGWQTEAPSPIPLGGGHIPPVALDPAGLARVRNGFADAAGRAARLGLDAVQVHAAHGYLLHQFLSPLSNQRSDSYGGSVENRMRFPLEVFDAVRAAFPADRPVTVRVSGTDWAEGGWTIEETALFARVLKEHGCSAIHVSSGGLTPAQRIPLGPSYQVPLARSVRGAGMPVVAVGLITDFVQAEAIVGTGDADLIALARAILYDPRWPWHAAAQLGATVKAPNQYLRSQPGQFPHLFKVRADD